MANHNNGVRKMLPPAEFQTSVDLMYDRIDYTVIHALGSKITVVLGNSEDEMEGETITGILRTAKDANDAEFDIVIENPTREYDINMRPLSDYQKSQSEPFSSNLLTIKHKNIVRIEINDVKFPEDKSKQQPPKSSSFQTDNAIASASNIKPGTERELTKWVDDSSSAETLKMDTSSSNGHWDQFKTNKEKFNVTSTFKESLYTTEVNTKAPDFEKKKAEADRIAKEIESQGSKNSHLAEERGHAVDSNLDEEDKYSGVLRSSTNTKSNVDESNKLMNLIKKNNSTDKLSSSPPKSKSTTPVLPPKKSQLSPAKASPPKLAPVKLASTPVITPRSTPSAQNAKSTPPASVKTPPASTPASVKTPPASTPTPAKKPSDNKFNKFNFNDSFDPNEAKATPKPTPTPQKHINPHQNQQYQQHQPYNNNNSNRGNNRQNGYNRHNQGQGYYNPGYQQYPQQYPQMMNPLQFQQMQQMQQMQVPQFQPMFNPPPQMGFQRPSKFFSQPISKRPEGKIIEGKFNFLLSAKEEYLNQEGIDKSEEIGLIAMERSFDSAAWNVSTVKYTDYFQSETMDVNMASMGYTARPMMPMQFPVQNEVGW